MIFVAQKQMKSLMKSQSILDLLWKKSRSLQRAKVHKMR